MSTLFFVVVVIQVVAALAIIGLVLLQHGKGADMGAAFGSGSAGSLFGSAGSSNFLSRCTAVAALIFFVATIGLVYVSNHESTHESAGVMDQVQQNTKPATEVPTPVPAASDAVPGDSVPNGSVAPATNEDKNSIPK